MLGCFLCPNTKAGVTRSVINAVSDVAGMGNQNWAKLTLQFLCKGIQEQRDKHHVQPSGCLFLLVVVFYLERVSPTVKPSIRKFPSLVVWGDDEIRRVLHKFDKIGGYDKEGVVVHFTQVGDASANEGGLSQISSADVQTMTTTFVTVAGPTFRQAAALLKGLWSSQSSPPTAFETHDIPMNESKGLSTNPSLGRSILLEMASRSQPEPEMAQEIDMDLVHPSARTSPQVTAPNGSETPTRKKCKMPEPVLKKSKGPDTRAVAKRRIQVDMDEDLCSPSPVKGFRSLAGLSRGRKRKMRNGNPVPHVGGYDNLEVHYKLPRLRQPD
ncbi:hypothetical protein RHMOL_Rhmol05G0015600 [Rhododendron molle]|uniref:Uncharacterized protein n=1 Tax=Rhododendron molle TaxID=49168 RepID=A0ACC0NKV3_RHOML|nr:hypothetical protein RHMOL_Rhmol05G0015600 [Rhododendron molle]